MLTQGCAYPTEGAKELTHGRDGLLSEPRALVLFVGVGEHQGVRANQGPVDEVEGTLLVQPIGDTLP